MNSGYSGQILLTLFCLMAVPSSGFSQGSEPNLTQLSLEDPILPLDRQPRDHASPSATYRLLSARCQLYADDRPSGVTQNDTSTMMPVGSRGRMFFQNS
jgi:hypothetical protein